MTKQDKRTKVLMIYPKFPPSYWGFQQSMKMLGLGAAMPPLGLATIAAMLPTKYFNVTKIVDLNFRKLKNADIKNADMVMLSAMTVQQVSLIETIQRVKNFGRTIVVGGPHAASHSRELLGIGVTHVIAGEAEMTLPPFVEDFLANRAECVYTEESVHSRVRIALARNGKPLITRVPIPRYDLLEMNMYSSMAVQFSRGCAHNCEFCEITVLFGHIPRAKTTEQIIAELDAIYQTGWRGSIFFVDDNFIGNRIAVRKLLPALIGWQKERGYPFVFYTEATLELADKELDDLREMMITAGFGEVFIGLESVDPEVLKAMNKKHNLVDLKEKVGIIQRDGLQVTAGFIVGNDEDKPTVFEAMRRFVQETGIVMAMVGILIATRGTALYKRLKSAGRIRFDSEGTNSHGFKINFTPIMDEAVLVDGYTNLLKKLYSSREYFARCLELRRRLGPSRHSIPLNWSGIRATLFVFAYFLFRHPDWEFAKFMFGTLFSKPGALPLAIKQAVKFVDFRTVTLETVRAHRYEEKAATLAEKFQRRAERLRGDMNKRMRKLAKLEGWANARLKKMYRKLDPNFRAGAEETLRTWHARLKSYADKYRQKWQVLSSAQ